MNREELIEEAAKAMHAGDLAASYASWEDSIEDTRNVSRRRARAALAVFERSAVTEPATDDERADMIAWLLRAQTNDRSPMGRDYTDAEIADALRRSTPEPTEPTDAMLDALYRTFMAHSRGVEFNEFDEHVCSECGEAFAWPDGRGSYKVPPRRNSRHIARAALRAALAVRQENEQ